MSEVDEYFASLDADARAAFERVRRLAMTVAPDAVDGTIRFDAATPLPDEVVLDLVRFRMAEIDDS